MTAATPSPPPPPRLSADGKTLAVHVPLQFKKRGGRKVVIAPSGDASAQTLGANQCTRSHNRAADTALVRAIAQAHRWQAMLDVGRFASLGDLARAEKRDKALVARTLRLTLLAPTVIDAILDGREGNTAQRQTLLRGFPLNWTEQERTLGAG